MRRPYTQDYYRRLVDSIVGRLPHASIGTDMIVGFPGETDDDFVANLDYLPASPLSHVHVFPVFGSSGHRRHRHAGKGPRRRSFASAATRLRAIGADLARRFRESQIGTVRPGLTIEDGTLVVTDNYLKVRIPAGLKRNRRVAVRLDDDGGTVVDATSDCDWTDDSALRLDCRPFPSSLLRQPLSRRRSRRLGDQLPARRPNVPAPRAADRHRDVMVRQDLGESVHPFV